MKTHCSCHFQVVTQGNISNIPGVSYTLTLERRPTYYLLNIIIPTVVLASLSALTFAVPVDSGEKLSLGISILLAFSVFMLILQDNTPQADTPLLGKYIWGHRKGLCKMAAIFSRLDKLTHPPLDKMDAIS